MIRSRTESVPLRSICTCTFALGSENDFACAPAGSASVSTSSANAAASDRLTKS